MNEFYGKTWVLTVQLLLFGGMAALSLTLGPLFLLGVMKDAYDEPRPEAGVPLTLIGLVLAPIAAVMGYGLRARRRPIIRLCREGIELRLVGRTSVESVPLIGGLVKWAWAAVSLQGFRTQCLRVGWEFVQDTQIVGLPMMRTLRVLWLTPPAGVVGVEFAEAELQPRLEQVDGAVGKLRRHPELRAALRSWSAPVTSSFD
jgi:hypothetical protein